MKIVLLTGCLVLSLVYSYAQQITNAEYFFDVDPGPGNATPITGFSPDDTLTITTSISTTGLSQGFHFLAVRVKDANNQWSHFEKKGFYIHAAPVAMPDLVAAEYFFDQDPGTENATPVSIGMTNDTLSFMAMIPQSLAGGFHTLAVRVKDQNGRWSLFEKRTFYVSPAPVSMPDIAAAEYFIGTDPGAGNGIPIAIGSPDDTISQPFTIPIPQSTPLGTYFYTVRVKDITGKWSHFKYDTVTVAISVPEDTILNADLGLCTKMVNGIDAMVLNSEPYSYTLTGATTGSGSGTASGLSFNAGVTTVTYTLTNFPTAFGSFTVTILDTELPVIICPANISVGSDVGVCGAVVNYSVSFSDNCPGALLTLVSGLASGSTFPAGTTNNIFQVADAAGNSLTCSFTVTVSDNLPPSITCPSNLTVNTDAGVCTTTNVILGTPVVNDNCGVSSTTNNELSTYPLGVTNVTWTATDVNALTATCVQTVTVVDNQNPDITCPANITTEAAPGTCEKIVTYSATATDNCGVSSITYNPVSGSSFPVGTSIVTATATDVNGRTSTCTFSVTIEDMEDPIITCPTDINQNTDTGLCTAILNFSATATDNCGIPVVSFTPMSGSSFPIGTTIVTATATDGSGRTSSCTFNATVTDAQPPTLSCPVNITVNTDEGLCTASNISLGTPATSDNCGVSSTTNNGLSVYPLGSTQVTWTTTDINGNTSTCIQTITVEDNQNPDITCPANITTEAVPGTCEKIVTYSASATDNCGVSSITYNPVSGSSFPVGTSIVTATATDVNDRISTCTFSVTIEDGEDPVITCPVDINQNTDPGLCSAILNFNATATDNCGTPVITLTPVSGSSFPIGTTIVTATATDDSGRTSSCTFNATVTDAQPPTLSCPINITVNTDEGFCTASNVSLGTPVTTDNCGIASTVNNAPVSFPIGLTNVVWTVMDDNGLTSTCMQTVTVTDNQDPIVNCPSNMLMVSHPDSCMKSVTYEATASDNCGIASIVYNPESGSSFGIGTSAVTVTATDVNGRSSSCSFTVTITENIAPEITCPADMYINIPSGCSAVVNYTVSFSDNCPGVTMTQSLGLPSGSSFPVGLTTNSFTATDASGNTNSCQFLVYIIPPGEIPNNNIDDDCDGLVDEVLLKTGVNTITPTAMLDVHQGDVLFSGLDSIPAIPGDPPVQGAGSRMMWYPDKGAFRSGYVSGAQWNKDSIGDYSIAFPYNSLGIGDFSIALGTSRALGTKTIALGDGALALGNYSVSIGITNWTANTAEYALSLGNFNYALGKYAAAIGSSNLASGNYSFALGKSNQSTGDTSMALGNSCMATGLNSFAAGYVVGAGGDYSFAAGSTAGASGSHAVVIGYDGQASGDYSFVLGRGNAAGKHSSSSGLKNKTNGYASFTTGMYNDTLVSVQSTIYPETPLFAVGNGDANNARSNAFVVRKDGNVGVGDNNPLFRLHVTNANDASGGWLNSIMVENTSSLANVGEASISWRNQLLPVNKRWTMGLNQNTKLAFNIGSSFGGANIKMVIDTFGRIGLGTQTPAFKTHIPNNNTQDGGWQQGVVIENISNYANVGEAGLSFRNNSLQTGKYWITGLNQNSLYAVNYGSSFTGASNKMVIDTFGRVGIMTNSPGFDLEVDGSAGKPGGGNWTASSDIRLKEAIVPFKDGIAAIGSMDPVTYRYNSESGYDPDPEYVGFIAQDLLRAAPFMVKTNNSSLPEKSQEYYTVDPSAATYMLINVVKEQQERIDQLKEKISILKTLINHKNSEK